MTPLLLALLLACEETEDPQVSACDPADAAVEGHSDADGPVLFELYGFSADDEDGDGVWSPGERLIIGGAIENVSGEDDMGYPGALIRAESGVALQADGTWWLYGLFDGQTADVQFAADAPEDAAPGTVVRFTVTAGRLNCGEGWGPCPNPAPRCFEVEIGE